MNERLWLTLMLAVAGCGIGDSPADPGERTAGLNAAGAEVSLEEATAIALAQVPGELDEAELETEDGITAYSVDISRDGSEVEVRVDPATGAILSTTDEADEEDEDDDGEDGDGSDEDDEDDDDGEEEDDEDDDGETGQGESR